MTLIVKSRFRRAAVATLLSALLAGPSTVSGWGGTGHKYAAHTSLLTFDLARQGDLAAPNTRTPRVERDAPFSFFPELLGTSTSFHRGNEPYADDVPIVDAQNWTIVWWNSNSPDQWEAFDYSVFGCPEATPATKTIRHFWDPDIGGAIGMTAGPFREANEPTESGVPELCPDPLLFPNHDLYPNAWVKGRLHWETAIAYWVEPTDDPIVRKTLDGWTWLHLGHALHMLMDGGQPAHTHEDMHNESDSLEKWTSQENIRITGLYSWFPPEYPASIPSAADGDWNSTAGSQPPGRIPVFGDLLYPPPNADVCTHLAGVSFTGSTYRYDDPIHMLNDPWLIDDCAQGTKKLGELYYLFYVLNQIGDYYPSDLGMGDTLEPTGWLQHYAGFPTQNDTGADIHDYAILDDNDDDAEADDDDGDLSLILTGLVPWQRQMYGLGAGHYGTYQATVLATRSAIDLFRRTLDDAAPVTSIAATTREGQAAKVGSGWNTSAVQVTVTGAEDKARLARASGVEMVLARWNGEDRGQGGTFDLFDGRHVIQGMSYDKFGNVDRTDYTVDIDTIPPTVTFPTLKPVYLTSEWFVPDWVATDALSGVDSTWGRLDGNPIVQGQPIDLALLAGFHVLRVYARDVAGNVGWTEYQLEVLIDANAWPKPDRWNVKSQGAHACVVEFPFPYDVGLIDVATVELAPGSIVAALPALDIAPPVDDDHDGLADRALRFDAGAFGAPLGGYEGDVPATLTGRLVGDELAPGFVATCTIPVFSPGP